MADERTVSRMTWINTPIRNGQDADTVMDHVTVGEFYMDQLAVCVSTALCISLLPSYEC
jgi:hypothetical protein